jgi:hypothetical protein
MLLRRVLFIGIFAISLLALPQISEIQAGDMYGWVGRRYYGPKPYYMGNPRIIDPNPVTGGLQTGTKRAPSQTAVDDSRKAYPYGYFGAQYRPYSVSSKNFYNDYSQWSYCRGY